MALNVMYEKKTGEIYCRTEKDGTNYAPHQLGCRLHLHRELELVLLFEGTTEVSVDSFHETLHAGDLFLTFPNQIHSYSTIEPEKYLLLIVKPDRMEEFREVFSLSSPVSNVLRGGAFNPKIRPLAERLFDVCREEPTPYQQAVLHGYLLALFGEILGEIPLRGVSVEDSDSLRSVINFCTSNYDQSLSLELLERELHLNKFYISHLFSSKLGLHFNDYVNSLRVSEACRYLLHSSHSITEISNLVGFNTLRTFNRAFIRQMGVSPSLYRKSPEPVSMPR